MSKEQKSSKSKAKNWKKIGLAYSIIGLSFLIIGMMLFIQQQSEQRQIDMLKFAIDNKLNKTQTDNIIAAGDSITKSNQALFNVLLPVFSAWVVAVVSYYFHSDAQQRSTEALQNAQNQISQAVSGNKAKTVGDLLKNSSGSYGVRENLLIENLEKIIDNSEDYGNVAIVTDYEKNEPIGVLYLRDIQRDVDTKNNLQTPLNNVIGKIKDSMTGQMWTSNGIENYVKASQDDYISDVLKKMEQIKLAPDAPKSDLRVLVIVDNKMIAIIGYETIAKINQ